MVALSSLLLVVGIFSLDAKGAITDEQLLGSYSKPSGLGLGPEVITLQPGKRFRYLITGCTTWYENKGSWTLHEGKVVLTPQLPRPHEERVVMSTEFFPFVWAGEIRLVEWNSAPALAASVHAMQTDQSAWDNLRYWLLYSKTTPEDALPSEKPLLPSWLQHFAEKGPIVAKIAGLEPRGLVRLNKGRADRVSVGLRLTNVKWSEHELIVVRVEEHRAYAQAFSFAGTDSKIAIGLEFTSGSSETRFRPTSVPRLPYRD